MPLFTINTLLLLSVLLPITAQATPRYDELLCEEVAEVILEAVALGTITQSIADEVISDCYNIYVPNLNV